jgi:hypothetical protein
MDILYPNFFHPGSRFRIIKELLIPDPGSRGRKGTGSRIRIRNTDAQVWEKAAEALRELAKVGNLVFPGLEQIRGGCAGGGGGGQGSETAAPASAQMEVGRHRKKSLIVQSSAIISKNP